jgi:hypothetical protein
MLMTAIAYTRTFRILVRYMHEFITIWTVDINHVATPVKFFLIKRFNMIMSLRLLAKGSN